MSKTKEVWLGLCRYSRHVGIYVQLPSSPGFEFLGGFEAFRRDGFEVGFQHLPAPLLATMQPIFFGSKKSISLLYYLKIPSPCSAMNHNPTSLGAPCGEQCIPGLKDVGNVGVS